MQATLDATALKHLTRALFCLSKYGDDLTIYATPQTFALSTTNSSMSAYCRFKYNRQFFSKYYVDIPAAEQSSPDVEEVATATGQLLTKSLLSILKHRNIEKTVDKCELSILEGISSAQDGDNDENEDTLESRLIVRLHCKHGVIKTHRLLLLTQTSLMAPGLPDTPCQSRLIIGPKALKDMIEHFPTSKAPKSDPQLIWNFSESEVSLRSLETSIDAKGKAQLATELTISADEFDVYDIYAVPTTIAFHLREFNATIAFAEASALPLDIHFTDPSAPLYIDVEGDLSETLFVISTSHISGVSGASATHARQRSTSAAPRGKKRELEDDSNPNVRKSGEGTGQSRLADRKQPMKVVHQTDRASLARELNGGNSRASSRTPGSMPPPSLPAAMPSQNAVPPSVPPVREPLFLPSSQLSQAAQDTIRQSGLGIESMTAGEFEMMMEGEGEEVDLGPDEELPAESETHTEEQDEPDSFDIYDVEMEPTQNEGGTKAFKPLFED